MPLRIISLMEEFITVYFDQLDHVCIEDQFSELKKVRLNVHCNRKGEQEMTRSSLARGIKIICCLFLHVRKNHHSKFIIEEFKKGFRISTPRLCVRIK